MEFFRNLLKHFGMGRDNASAESGTDKKYWDMFSRVKNIDVQNPGWTKVKKKSVAPEDGLFVFRCLGDNHDIWESYELKKGDSLHLYFSGSHIHDDGWWPVVVPMEYMKIPAYNDDNPDWVKPQGQPALGENMNQFNDGGFIIVAIKCSGQIKYFDQENCPYIKVEHVMRETVVSGKAEKVLTRILLWDVECTDDFKLLGFYKMP